MKSIVYIEKIKSIKSSTKSLMDKLNWREKVPTDSCVYIKLNLSSINPNTLHCANTNIEVAEAVIETLLEKTNNIFLCESNGMRYSADEAFEINGYNELAKKHGVSLVNLSKEPKVYDIDPLLEGFGLPEALLKDNKVLITLPLIKTHALTGFTGAIKNQWGLVPRYDRILLHKNINRLLPIINKKFKIDFAIMGGPWAMEGRGPTNGKPKKFPLMLASDKIACLDATAMRLIGLCPNDCKHVKLSGSEELGVIESEGIDIVGEFENFREDFEPAVFDWALRSMDSLTRYQFFVHKILLNKSIFSISRSVVQFGRKLGLVR